MAKKKNTKHSNNHESCHAHNADSQDLASKNNAHRRSSYISGIVAGFLACICCCLPVIALAIGIATIKNVAWFETYHLQFELLGWLIMLAAVFFIWSKHRQAKVPMLKDKHFWIPLICMIIVYTGMNFAVQEFIAPAFPHLTGHEH